MESTETNLAKAFPPSIRPTAPTEQAMTDRCIPDSASTCESPAFLKARDTDGSMYSLFPDSKASKRPPALPHSYRSLVRPNLSDERTRASQASGERAGRPDR